jgi:hypothetical protein
MSNRKERKTDPKNEDDAQDDDPSPPPKKKYKHDSTPVRSYDALIE